MLQAGELLREKVIQSMLSHLFERDTMLTAWNYLNLTGCNVIVRLKRH